MREWIVKKFWTKAMLVTYRGILILLALSLIAGCGLPDENGISPNGDPGGSFYSLAVDNRFEAGLSQELARGKDLYLQNCAICHGELGDGKGFNAYNLKSSFGVQPFNFMNSNAAANLTLNEIKNAVTNGGPAVNRSQYMPPWGFTLGEYNVACISSYVLHSLIKKKSG